MPALSAETASFLRRVKDDLTQGQDRPAFASLVLNGAIEITAADPGAAGNAWTVEVVLPTADGPSPLSVGVAGTAITITLAIDGLDEPVDAANTAALITTAINAATTAVVARLIQSGGTTVFDADLGPLSLAGGSDNPSLTPSAPVNFLRAQDMATVFALLQDALSQPTPLTATGGSLTSVVDGAATFEAHSQIGNLVLFAGNTTAALAGVVARVVANNTTTLFFAPGSLPAAPVATDTYTIIGGLFDVAIEKLRDGKGLADAPAGSVYGDVYTVQDALVRGLEQLNASLAQQKVFSGVVLAGTTDELVLVNTRGGELRNDEFRGLKVVVDGTHVRTIYNHVGNAFPMVPALSAVPDPGDTFEVFVPVDQTYSANFIKAHPGGQPGDNYRLADLIDQLEAAVEAFVLPT